jgi:uncharacterized membrane protein YciS (DUF1049 family)
MTYEIFDPKVNRPLHELSREDAQIAYTWFVANISERLNELGGLLFHAGIALDGSDASLQDTHKWFVSQVLEERKLGNTEPSSKLFSVCNDIGIYFSEIIIREGKKIHWKFFIKDEKGLSYQRPVISGFDVKNKDYYIDFDYLICQYAFRILKTGNDESGLFNAMVQKARSLS